MPVELRKRKAAAAPPAAPPPAKKKQNPAKAAPAKAANGKKAAVASTNGASLSGKVAPGKVAVGAKISLQGFGGQIETQDGEKTSLKDLLDASKAGVVLFTYPKASTPGCESICSAPSSHIDVAPKAPRKPASSATHTLH